MLNILKTLQCRNTLVLRVYFHAGLQIVLVGKLPRLLGLLQLLDALEDSLTTGVFFLG